MTANLTKIISRLQKEVFNELFYLTSKTKPKKVFFDHVPKCGGLSLTDYLQAHYLRRKTFSVNTYAITTSTEDFKNASQQTRYKYDLVKGHMAHELIDHVSPECIKVTVLREPVDRIISHYYYAKRVPTHYLFPIIHGSNMELKDYATSNLSLELRNWYTTHYSGLNLDLAEQNAEESIGKAYDVLMNRYDIVGLLSNLSEFAESLKKRANFRFTYMNKKVNVTNNRLSVSQVDNMVLSRIKEVNYLDVILYEKIRDAIIYKTSKNLFT